MLDFLAIAYPWVKALHIMSVISWMAALFYLPRLLVHHTERVGLEGETHSLFTMMEGKLANVIMRPAMIATWIFGLGLVMTPGIVDWSMIWPWTKLVGVVLMTVFHVWLVRRVKSFALGENNLTGRQYRMMNEVPTLLMILIVLSVVVKF
ncbi:Membrane protein [Sulfitobacter noctilucicola]|uniref:Protoporphyrinogen IX oxidase n=1 Tax=Sulfitobacter noctilucicola TaxID=1342301 RepID=A0A7W6M700_9RHOB|nr:CopD family protein [Sulfitobacter noctilucicola]KIN62828.1 Membrane protein [Sulfitobacter noctilucicola]MBB4172641.1 putative membrane protein [Sulfitobacter noctilucicola]